MAQMKHLGSKSDPCTYLLPMIIPLIELELPEFEHHPKTVQAIRRL